MTGTALTDHRRFQTLIAVDRQQYRFRRLGRAVVAETTHRPVCVQRCAVRKSQAIEGRVTGGRSAF